MSELTGYINDSRVVVKNVDLRAFEGRKIILTILDSTESTSEKKSLSDEVINKYRGDWESFNDGVSVEETVRSMRKGRRFDF